MTLIHATATYLHHSPARHSGNATVSGQIVLAFTRGDAHLRYSEGRVLERWVSAWLPFLPMCVVFIGASGQVLRADRLRYLRQALVMNCVPADQIRSTDKAIEVPVDSVPNIASFPFVDAAVVNAQVRSMVSFIKQAVFPPSQEMACTSES